jgi:crotonobetainyl-CoA:carnitine CoA-transferase CaiB-like acyl-CoA transferase
VPGPLDGLLVVDLTRALAGPHASMMMGDLGARVIKVEPPQGDDSRSWGPPFVGPVDEPISTYFLSCNRSKESVTADLRTDEGGNLLSDLVRRADVLMENYRPGVLDRLGFDRDRLHELNPGLVVLSISGFGHDGPESARPGFDQVAQGEAGLMSLTGHKGEPTRVGVPIADLLAGMTGLIGVLSALHERQSTGRGTVVRTSLLASVVGIHAFQGTRWTVAGEVPEPVGNHHPAIAPYGLFRGEDAFLQICVGSANQWQAFAPLVGLEADDQRFADNSARVAHRDELCALIERSLADAPVQVWLDRLASAGVPAGRVRTLDEVYEWEQTRSQHLLTKVAHPLLGELTLPGSPLRFEPIDPSVDDQVASAVHQHPPMLGEHDASVRAWLADSEPDPDAVEVPDSLLDHDRRGEQGVR